MSSSDLERQVK